MLADRRITIALSEAAKKPIWLTPVGIQSSALVPLKRAIQRELQDPLALAILEGAVQEGDHVWVDISETGDELSFQSQTLAPAIS